jgi:asparagine synthase (glutamine-hydrolysing)
VARAASEAGLRVALSGLGGDELFGGYPSFREIPRLLAITGRLPTGRTIGRGLRMLSAPILKYATSPKYAGLLEYGSSVEGAYLLRRGLFLPWELPSVLDADLVQAGIRDLATEQTLNSTVRGVRSSRFQISTLEATWYMRNQLLRDADWASMSHSLEVRVPLVDATLWREVAALMRGSATLDKRSMATTMKTPLPSAVLNRPKTGFHVPTREWMQESRTPRSRGLRGWAHFVYDAAAAA